MAYVDGFLVGVPTANLADYAKMSKKAGKIWREFGALDYKECALDDAEVGKVKSFPKVYKVKADETIIFAYILYKSKADRNRINKLVMADPRMAKMMDPNKPIFDWKKMVMSGFKVIVEA